MPSVVRLTFWKLLSSDTRWNHLKKTIYVICSYFYRIAFPPSVPSRKPWPDKAPVQTKTAILARILERIEAATRRESHNYRIHALPDSPSKA